MDLSRLKILLVQIRKDAMKEHEQQCVVDKSGLRSEQIVSFDIFERLMSPADLDGFDALIIGGSGAFCVSERQIVAENESIEEVIREARKRGLPTLGICYGHHLIAEAFGAVVKQDRARQETGTFSVTKTLAAEHDPIFQQLPSSFRAQQGHKDHVMALPSGAVSLATSEQSPYQAFVFPGEPIYSVQFHPELGREDVLTRLTFYHDQYLKKMLTTGVSDAGASGKADEFNAIAEKTTETPDAERVIRLFLEEIVVGGKRCGQPSV